MMEQQDAVNRVLENGRKAITKLNWQHKDVLVSLDKALKPVSDFTDILGGEKYVTISSLIPVLKLMETDTLCAAEGDVDLTRDVKAGILTRLKGKYNDDKVREIMHVACFIDPLYRGTRFSGAELEDTVRKVEEEAITPAKEMERPEDKVLVEESNAAAAAASSPPKKRRSLGSLLSDTAVAAAAIPKTTEQRVSDEMLIYKQEAVVHVEEYPLGWWRKSQFHFPLLANVARKYLCICATSTASERLFSKAGNVVTAQRCHLKPAKVDMLVFLAKNLEFDD